jgi:hypothetical protein
MNGAAAEDTCPLTAEQTDYLSIIGTSEAGTFNEEIDNEVRRIRDLMRREAVHGDPVFDHLLQELWVVTHFLKRGSPPPSSLEAFLHLLTRSPPSESASEPREILSSFLISAGLERHVETFIEFGVETLADFDPELLTEEVLVRDIGLTVEEVGSLRRSMISVGAFEASFQTNSAAKSTESNIPKFEAVSPHWMEVGFQSEDPAVEFRALGVWGMECVLHSLRFRPATAVNLLNSKIPLVAAAINVSLLVANLLSVVKSTLISSTLEHPGPRVYLLLPAQTRAGKHLEAPSGRESREMGCRIRGNRNCSSSSSTSTSTTSSENSSEGHANEILKRDSGFLAITSVALSLISRVAEDTGASIMDFSALLHATREDLCMLLCLEGHGLFSRPPSSAQELWERCHLIPKRRAGPVLCFQFDDAAKKKREAKLLARRSIWITLANGKLRVYNKDALLDEIGSSTVAAIAKLPDSELLLTPSSKVSIDQQKLRIKVVARTEAEQESGIGESDSFDSRFEAGTKMSDCPLSLRSFSFVCHSLSALDRWGVALTEHIALLHFADNEASVYFNVTGRLAIDSAALSF